MNKFSTPDPNREFDEKIRQARRDYPQPEYLDFCYLAAREVQELREMVEKSASETELDHFIRGEPNLLSSLLHFASTGHHGGKAYPQQVIRPSVRGEIKGQIPDYLVSGESSEGTSWWVLELKGPKEKIFVKTADGLKLGDTANKGLLQIHKYVEFCKEHHASLRDTLGLKDFSTPNGILIIGREAELLDPERRTLKKALGGPLTPIRIRTWDSLLRSLEHKLAFIGQREIDPLRGPQLEDWASDSPNEKSLR